MSQPRRPSPVAPRPGGFSLIEAVLSVVVVGILMVAALNTVGASRTAQVAAARRSQGILLAEDLMAEILVQPYEDPATSGDKTLGREVDEGPTRENFDDVDDYANWVESPPARRDGTVIGWAKGYRRAVSVQWCDPAAPDTDATAPSGVKRVTIVVGYGDRHILTLQALRTECWVRPAVVQE